MRSCKITIVTTYISLLMASRNLFCSHYRQQLRQEIWQVYSYYNASKVKLKVNLDLGIQLREFTEECLEMLIRIPYIIHGTHLPDAVHWQLWGSNIDCTDSNATWQYWAYGRTTWHVIPNHEILNNGVKWITNDIWAQCVIISIKKKGQI
jgi:hypothetical protein